MREVFGERRTAKQRTARADKPTEDAQFFVEVSRAAGAKRLTRLAEKWDGTTVFISPGTVRFAFGTWLLTLCLPARHNPFDTIYELAAGLILPPIPVLDRYRTNPGFFGKFGERHTHIRAVASDPLRRN